MRIKNWMSLSVVAVLGWLALAGLARAEGDAAREKTGREEKLKRFDKDGDGKLSEEELRAMNEALHRERKTRDPEKERAGDRKTDEERAKREEMKKRLIRNADSNGDGQLSEEEIQAARGRVKHMVERMRERAPKAVKAIEKRFDKDGNGLSEEERLEAFHFFMEKREEMLKRFDADQDGKLNEDERAAAKEAVQERHRECGLLREMEAADTDGDGSLSETEKEAARERLKTILARRRAEQEQRENRERQPAESGPSEDRHSTERPAPGDSGEAGETRPNDRR